MSGGFGPPTPSGIQGVRFEGCIFYHAIDHWRNQCPHYIEMIHRGEIYMGPEGRRCLGKPGIGASPLWFHRGASQKKQIEDAMVARGHQSNMGAVSMIMLGTNPYDSNDDTDDELILGDDLIRCRVIV